MLCASLARFLVKNYNQKIVGCTIIKYNYKNVLIIGIKESVLSAEQHYEPQNIVHLL